MVRRFDHYLAANQFTENARRNYRYPIYRFLAETCPEDFRDVTEEHVAAFLESLGNRTPAKVHYLHALRRFLGWAYRRGQNGRRPGRLTV